MKHLFQADLLCSSVGIAVRVQEERQRARGVGNETGSLLLGAGIYRCTGGRLQPLLRIRTADAGAKMAAADWAMKQDEIKNDPNGEWAIQATASSTYNDAQGTAGYSANQATGAPNVDKYADDGAAWTSKTPDSGIEWLDLRYPKPVYATEVRVRESVAREL